MANKKYINIKYWKTWITLNHNWVYLQETYSQRNAYLLKSLVEFKLGFGSFGNFNSFISQETIPKISVEKQVSKTINKIQNSEACKSKIKLNENQTKKKISIFWWKFFWRSQISADMILITDFPKITFPLCRLFILKQSEVFSSRRVWK